MRLADLDGNEYGASWERSPHASFVVVLVLVLVIVTADPLISDRTDPTDPTDRTKAIAF